ncbi:hypothetical protein D3C76_1156950 [compost metagenome]
MTHFRVENRMNETVMEKENAVEVRPNTGLRPVARNNSEPSIRSWPTLKNSDPASDANDLLFLNLQQNVTF